MGRRRRELAADCTAIAHGVHPLDWGGFIIRPTDAKYTNVLDAPNESGIYAWYTKDRELMYVGRSKAICTRLIQHQRGTAFLGGRPTYYSFRIVPERFIAGVENAHIRTLDPIENQWRDSFSVPFERELEAAIESAWAGVLVAQQESLNRKYLALAEQIAARL